MKILIFGNPLVPQDSLAINLIPRLEKAFSNIKFLHLDPTENLEEHGPNLTIIDVVHGIKDPLIITDPDKLKIEKISSMHDFDLGYNLKLLLQAKKIKSVKILGLPYDMDKREAFEWVKRNL